MKNQGFIFIPILVFVVFIVGGAGTYFYVKHNKTSNIQNVVEIFTPTPTGANTPTLTPISTFTPPIPTKKPQPTLTKAPTLTPTVNLNDCSRFKPEDGLATITISLKEKDGKSLLGDWTVTIKPTGSCPAILPYGNQPLFNVIKQYTYTFTTVGFHPGQVRVDVNYHYSGEGFDVDATSGNHVREVVVSN